MQSISLSFPAYALTQSLSNMTGLSAVTFAVDQTINQVIQRFWSNEQESAKQVAMPVKVFSSFVIAQSFLVKGSLLSAYAVYATAKTVTNCMKFILSRGSLEDRVNTIGLVTLASMLASSLVFLTAHFVGAPISLRDATLVTGCLAHWITRSFPETVETKLGITGVEY